MNRDADDIASNIIQVAEAFAYAKTALLRKKQSSSCEKNRHGDQA
jgi:hypothetical protein